MESNYVELIVRITTCSVYKINLTKKLISDSNESISGLVIIATSFLQHFMLNGHSNYAAVGKYMWTGCPW